LKRKTIGLALQDKALLCSTQAIKFSCEHILVTPLGRTFIEPQLLIKVGFRPYKQGAQNFKPEIVGRVKEEVD
jgi:hypothetical protein